MGLVLGVWELCHQGRTVGVVLDVGEQLHQGRTCHQREMEHQCGDGVMHFVYLVAAFHQCIFEKIEQIIFHLFLELSFPLHGITHAEPLQPLLQQILALLWSWPFANPFKDISGSQRRDWHYRGFSTKAQYPEVFWDPPDTKGRVPTIVVLALV